MTLSEVAQILEAEILAGIENLHREVTSVCGSDLMSDVLAFLNDKTLLITGLVNPQVIRTAEMLDIIGVVFVRGKKPDLFTIRLAEEKGLPLLSTKYSMFETCGLLYSELCYGKEN